MPLKSAKYSLEKISLLYHLAVAKYPLKMHTTHKLLTMSSLFFIVSRAPKRCFYWNQVQILFYLATHIHTRKKSIFTRGKETISKKKTCGISFMLLSNGSDENRKFSIKMDGNNPKQKYEQVCLMTQIKLVLRAISIFHNMYQRCRRVQPVRIIMEFFLFFLFSFQNTNNSNGMVQDNNDEKSGVQWRKTSAFVENFGRKMMEHRKNIVKLIHKYSANMQRQHFHLVFTLEFLSNLDDGCRLK